MKWIIGILAAVLLGGLIATTLVAVSDSHRNAVQSQQLNVQAKEIRALTTHVDNLGAQVGSISQPSDLCVPKISSTSCDQVILVNQATDLSVLSDAVPVEVDGVA